MVQFLSSLALLLFTAGCSSKKEFEPKTIEQKSVSFINQGIKIESINGSIATLRKNRAITTDGTKVKLNIDGDVIQIDDDNSTLQIRDKAIYFNSEQVIELSHKVVKASKRDDMVAYILSNGDIGLYSINEKSTIFREKYESVDTIDSRLPNPLFDGRTIIFFTLNGKLAVYNLNSNTLVREFTIGIAKDYSNVIDFKMSKESLYLLTQREIVKLSELGDERREFNIRGAIFDKNIIYIVEKDGSVIKLDSELNRLASIKSPFAYFRSWGLSGDKIYLIESNGYIIETDLELENYRVFESTLSDERCFFSRDRFICDNKFFRLPL